MTISRLSELVQPSQNKPLKSKEFGDIYNLIRRIGNSQNSNQVMGKKILTNSQGYKLYYRDILRKRKEAWRR